MIKKYISPEHVIYNILLKNIQEDIGVIGRDKPVGMPQGGFAPSFSSFHPNTTINRKRNASQQKSASPIASFESGGGKNTRNIVPNQGDAPSVGDLSARGASESGKNKSIRTKLKEMNDAYFVEDDTNTTNTTVKNKTKSGNVANKPSTASDIKNLYHDTMGNLSEPKKKIPDFSNTEVLGTPLIPFPFAGKLYNLLTKPTEMQALPRQEAPKQLPPPVSGGSGSTPKPAPQAPTSVPQTPKQAPQAPTAPPTSAPKQQEMPSPQGQQGTQTKTKEKSDFPPLEPPKPETTENVPTKPGTGPETPSTTTKLEPKPGNPPESNRQPETNAEPSPSPKTTTEPSPSVKPVTGEKPSTAVETKPSTAVETKPSTAVDNPLLRGAGLGGLAGAGGLGALLGYLAGRGGGEKGGVKPSGFLYPNQSEISGFSWTPLGMATNMAKNTPNADKSHILARLSTLIPATKKAKRAGEEPEKVTEETEIDEMTETAKPNLDKERREIEYVGRKDMIQGKNKNPERKQFHKSTLGKTSAIQTRIIDEGSRNIIIKEAIANAVKKKKSENKNSKNSEKMTVGQEKTEIDIHPVLKSPPENQMGRAN
jgi:hypothetical protein